MANLLINSGDAVLVVYQMLLKIISVIWQVKKVMRI